MKKRNNLFQSVLLILDESMIGWKHKTTSTGSLPNITQEPRKPKDLDSMLRNGCECLSVATVNNDSVAIPEKKNQKKLYGMKSYFKKSNKDEKEIITTHMSEVLRQVENVDLPTDITG